MSTQAPEGYIILGTGEELNALGLKKRCRNLKYQKPDILSWDHSDFPSWIQGLTYAAKIHSTTHHEFLIAEAQSTQPKCSYDIPEGFIYIGTGKHLESLGLKKRCGDLLHLRFRGWDTSVGASWHLNGLYAAKIESTTHHEFLIAKAQSTLPKCPYVIPVGFIYIGTGEHLENLGVEKIRDGLMCRNNPNQWLQTVRAPFWNTDCHYVAKKGSAAYHAYIGALKRAHKAPVYVDDSTKDTTMNKNNFTVRPDGSLRHHPTDAVLNADQVKNLYNYLTVNPPVAGHRVQPLTLKIGCQTIPATDVEAFIREYESGDWKKPAEKTYQQGQQFRHANGSVCVLAQVESGKVAMIGICEGNRWFEPIEPADICSIKLSEVVPNPSDWKEVPQ